PHPPTVILGARTADWVLMARDFRQLGSTVTITTDDGSLGEKGTVMGPLSRWLAQHPKGQVFACGPTPMLAAVAELTKDRAPTQLALEQRMGCGVGACLACAVLVNTDHGPGYARVCSDGPVFQAEELIW
ncbi:MAG: dihydroorotate dehydrogenase electron transfer subunit, partial [Firmicutes bacterium]|nr:dihydroorotate dehydrogenase electron transfer subunit [Bacillota bacterium]